MAEIQITTTQNVTISFKAAEAGERILAYFIDTLIKSAYIGVIIYIISKFYEKQGGTVSKSLENDMWTIMAIIIIIFSPVIFYTLVQESLLNGQTLGKKIAKIQVVKIDGYQAGLVDYFIRWIMRIIDINLFSGVIALLIIGSSKKHQRLGGMASGTAVITLKNKITIDHTILQKVENNYEPVYTSVLKLSDNDVRIIKENLLRALKTNDHATLLVIKNKIIDVIGQEPAKDITAEHFIKRIIKDYNYYSTLG